MRDLFGGRGLGQEGLGCWGGDDGGGCHGHCLGLISPMELLMILSLR